MYAAGVMSLETTFKAIQKRADLMNASATGGAMSAVLNATEEQIKSALEEGSKVGYVDVANYNSPAQVVITGDNDAVAKAGEWLLANGVRRVVPLPVSGAFHSKFMEKASEGFAEFATSLELNNALVPVITNVDAQSTTNSEDFRAKMPKQICSSVYWTQTIQKWLKKALNTLLKLDPVKFLRV